MEDIEAEDAMKEMMGFSSFGSNKRQKLDPDTKNPQTRKPQGTSSNNTPLGKRPATKDTMKPALPLNMVPASILPRSSKSASRVEQPRVEPESTAAAVPGLGNIEAREAGSGDVQDQTQDLSTNTLPHHQKPTSTSDTAPPPSTSTTSAAPLNATAPSYMPPTAPVPGTTQPNPQPTSIYTPNDIRSDPAYWTQSQPQAPQAALGTNTSGFNTQRYREDPDEIVFTAPETGIAFTRKELREWGRGKEVLRADGGVELCFFKASFVEDPWAYLVGKGKGVA